MSSKYSNELSWNSPIFHSFFFRLACQFLCEYTHVCTWSLLTTSDFLLYSMPAVYLNEPADPPLWQTSGEHGADTWRFWFDLMKLTFEHGFNRNLFLGFIKRTERETNEGERRREVKTNQSSNSYNHIGPLFLHLNTTQKKIASQRNNNNCEVLNGSQSLLNESPMLFTPIHQPQPPPSADFVAVYTTCT